MFGATATRTRLVISRMGGEAVLRRKREGSTDRLNHSTGDYADEGTILCAPYYPDGESGQTEAGELDLDAPLFAVPADADIRQNDRLVYEMTKYEVEAVTTRQHYLVVQTKETG